MQNQSVVRTAIETKKANFPQSEDLFGTIEFSVASVRSRILKRPMKIFAVGGELKLSLKNLLAPRDSWFSAPERSMTRVSAERTDSELGGQLSLNLVGADVSVSSKSSETTFAEFKVREMTVIETGNEKQPSWNYSTAKEVAFLSGAKPYNERICEMRLENSQLPGEVSVDITVSRLKTTEVSFQTKQKHVASLARAAIKKELRRAKRDTQNVFREVVEPDETLELEFS